MMSFAESIAAENGAIDRFSVTVEHVFYCFNYVLMMSFAEL